MRRTCLTRAAQLGLPETAIFTPTEVGWETHLVSDRNSNQVLRYARVDSLFLAELFVRSCPRMNSQGFTVAHAEHG